MVKDLKILFDLGHPAHVHFFKYTMRNLETKGHTIKICVRERENMVKTLLTAYGFPYESLERNKPGLINKSLAMIKNDIKLLNISNKFNPDIFVSLGSPYSAQVGRLKRKPSIIFTDSEPTRLILSLTIPFTDVVITPVLFQRDFGNKQVRINGFKEIAYLHPNWFKPDISVLDKLGLNKGEKFVILRFNAFDASHDFGIKGFSLTDKRKLIRSIEKYAAVFISSEINLPPDLSRYAIGIPPHMMHDALYFAALLVCDTQTSTTEAACLGTPAVRCNSFVGPSDMSNFLELEQKYHLIFNYRDSEAAIDKAIELLKKEDIKSEWRQKRDVMLKDKIDVTSFMSWFIENYPKSYDHIKQNPDFQKGFF